jgi:hypothetical protein
MKRWATAGISVLALGMAVVGTGCADGGEGAGATDQVTPTESLLDPEQSGPVDAPAE